MFNGLKDGMTDLIEKLIDVTSETGWTFEIQADGFPITITFYNGQVSLFEEREDPPKIKFIFGSNLVYETDHKAKITRELFSKFEKISKDVVSLYYILFHACIGEHIKTIWDTADGARVCLVGSNILDGIFKEAHAEAFLPGREK